MTVTVVSILNNGDGTYTITYSQAITNLNPGVDTPDPNLIMYSPSAGDWLHIVFNAAESGATITVAIDTAVNDATLFAQLDQPLDLSAADVFEVAAPITPIT